jgi:hypothetical protein
MPLTAPAAGVAAPRRADLAPPRFEAAMPFPAKSTRRGKEGKSRRKGRKEKCNLGI